MKSIASARIEMGSGMIEQNRAELIAQGRSTRIGTANRREFRARCSHSTSNSALRRFSGAVDAVEHDEGRLWHFVDCSLHGME
jgi:hypothetical protein